MQMKLLKNSTLNKTYKYWNWDEDDKSIVY